MSDAHSANEKEQPQLDDVEKAAADHHKEHHKPNIVELLHLQEGIVYERHPEKHARWYQRLLDYGLEDNGIMPVPLELRTSTEYNQLFTVFFTCLLCLLPIPTGMLATLIFGMSLRDGALVILFFSMLCCAIPAYMCIGGMMTGLRQLVQARYSFGLYIVMIPLLLNAATVTGFSLLSSIVGGQAIASLNPERVSNNVGIVIVCLGSFIVTFMGYKAVHWWERWTWIPNLIAIVITVGCGGKYLHMQTEVPPATVQQILSFGGLMAGYFITFGGCVGDYSIYHNPNVSKWRVFLYVYAGLFIPSVPLLILGAAIGGAVPEVPSWQAAYEVTGIGGVVAEMLTPAGGFGKFIIVLLALSVIGNIAISMYSVALNLQMLLPFLAKIPRFVFIVITMAIMIPMAIKASEEWEASLGNFLALIGYWAGCFDAVLLEELILFRKLDYNTYDHAIWNVGRRLPSGIPAIAASILSFGLVVPCIDQVWYTGPIAEKTGDIGFEVSLVLTAIFYYPFRWLEIKYRGHI